jgi:hypothetical protein
MFTLRYFSTKTSDWVQLAQSDDPRLIISKFDEIAGQRTVPCVELIHEERVVVRLGLSKHYLMKVAVWGQQLRIKPEDVKKRFFKYRKQGVKAVKGGRHEVLDALVL